MEKLRFNPFHQIHQALRALLYHASLTVQHTDFTVAEQTNKTLLLLEELVIIFEGHADTEDTLVFPMIAATSAEVVMYFEQQHEKDHELGEDLMEAIKSCRSAVTVTGKILAGQKLQRALTEFTAFNLTHMNQEETVVLSLLWQHFTDEQILAKEIEILASLSPEKKALSGYWMLKGLSMNEIIAWFKKIKITAPSFVLDEFMQLAEGALSAEKLKILRNALQLSLA